MVARPGMRHRGISLVMTVLQGNDLTSQQQPTHDGVIKSSNEAFKWHAVGNYVQGDMPERARMGTLLDQCLPLVI